MQPGAPIPGGYVLLARAKLNSQLWMLGADGRLDWTALEARYGDRVMDRLRDMCVLVPFEPGSHRGQQERTGTK